ncbi:hypothetical protein OSB04_021729 [Centaurea solstitialis]|uniref:Ascorbate peroxidase n=1 Tax=Centaurea solstitialis TaxID=347529 RepID=A0AA38WI10_9ASTR|nr:hypothetical protein OSB04_021729 [Centaurea solstitialis]
MLRLAWHDAGTYDVNTKTGGPNGSIRTEEEYSHGSNNGLKIAIDFCETKGFWGLAVVVVGASVGPGSCEREAVQWVWVDKADSSDMDKGKKR